jgi:hypothetical protein
VFSCRQEVNFQGVCLNGTHPYLLAGFRPFLTFPVKLAVRIVYGQWTESTTPRVLSRGELQAEIQLKNADRVAASDRWRVSLELGKTLSAVSRLC